MLPAKNSPEWHKLQVAKKTLKMTSIMAQIMGGMTIDEAKKVVAQYSKPKNVLLT